MEQKYIMTALGKDRPGIVADVTQVLYENGCNLEDSRMAILGDEFALMILFSGSGKSELEDSLSRECRRLDKEKRIAAYIRPVSGTGERPKTPHITRTLSVEGIDQAGIVYKISRYLADNNINIANIDSQRNFTPESGVAIYQMEIEIQVPEGVVLKDLEKSLDRIAEELNVDIAFS